MVTATLDLALVKSKVLEIRKKPENKGYVECCDAIIENLMRSGGVTQREYIVNSQMEESIKEMLIEHLDSEFDHDRHEVADEVIRSIKQDGIQLY